MNVIANPTTPREIISQDTEQVRRVRFGRSGWRRVAVGAIGCLILAVSSAYVMACPFCSAPQLAMAEQIAQTDATVIVEWVTGTQPNFEAGVAGSTTYRVLQVIKAPAAPELKPGQEITVPEFYTAKPGDSLLLIGTLDGQISWLSPFEISRSHFHYILNLPSPENDQASRLKYFLNYLESADPLAADDAYAEFANTPYQVIHSVRADFPVEKLRKWVFSPETPATRLGLYGLMLGLSGNSADAEKMREKIVQNEEDFRLGIDGVMGGYLVLAGEDGLKALEESKLKPALQQPSPVPFSETFAAMQAIKFLWEYAPDRVPKERLRASLRTLLEHPDLADLVIIDLARWEDWSILPQLKAMYGHDNYNIPAIKRAIVGYLIQCVKQKPTEEGVAVPEYVQQAEEFLAQLEESDPRTVKTARLLFR